MSPDIDRSSPIPLHYQLKQILLGKIEQNEWQTGDMFPTEQELQNSYQLSRTTVRQTLLDLTAEGWLVRQRGRGTFVTRPKFTHSPEEHYGLTDQLLRQGITPGWKIVAQEWAQPAIEIRAALRLAPEEPAYTICRLRLAGEEPIGYHSAYLPEAIAALIDHRALSEGESLRYLKQLPQMYNSRAQRTIEAVAASEIETTWLGMEPGAPVLLIERLITTEDGTPLEFLQAHYRGDRFRYQIP
ncbi:MAG: GntR family transcriptional regulator [Chloroflexales bacterium]|nr:GntR family transcriptional regulator [Chloroflexales bacterium]